mmetsp:Transcript_19116/g.47904  ORF Transcript_19116/g.47904 Transcript_19116/m.47904 type:complete len:228 (+) Transcript_19116:113-796(+)
MYRSQKFCGNAPTSVSKASLSADERPLRRPPPPRTWPLFEAAEMAKALNHPVTSISTASSPRGGAGAFAFLRVFFFLLFLAFSSVFWTLLPSVPFPEDPLSSAPSLASCATRCFRATPPDRASEFATTSSEPPSAFSPMLATFSSSVPDPATLSEASGLKSRRQPDSAPPVPASYSDDVKSVVSSFCCIWVNCKSLPFGAQRKWKPALEGVTSIMSDKLPSAPMKVN